MHRRVFLHGFSASGTFVNRFAALHPDPVRAVAAGGINALPILPFATLRATPLPYPVGVGDFEAIVGTPFDLAAYQRVSQYLYMGYLDRNDTLPYGDAWNDAERALIGRLLGEEMMPTRWERVRALLAEAQLPVQVVTYNGVAHRILPEMWDDIVAFFEANDGEAHTNISPHQYRFVPYRRIEKTLSSQGCPCEGHRPRHLPRRGASGQAQPGPPSHLRVRTRRPRGR